MDKKYQATPIYRCWNYLADFNKPNIIVYFAIGL